MLLPRVLTGLVGIPAVAFLIHLGSLPYTAFVFVIIALALYEYYLLMKMGGKPVQGPVLFALGLLLPAAMCLDHSPSAQPGGDNFAGSVLTLVVIVPLVYEMFSGKKYLERIGFTLLGLFMVSWCLFHLIALRDIRPDGEALTFMLIVTVWVMDTVAYACGRGFGKRQLSTISPKKTWEGAIAGFVSAVLMTFLFRSFMKETVTPAYALAAGTIIGVFGQLSDIAESMLKRAAGAKDSSNLLPGHGGILDRFDSYIFLAPMVYYLTVYFR
ncbi:MAG TPA: phosphatidate cytidylyltransferase [Elusimicrobiales bacterium]|nr:phosphatidate cytidylyltransferase [Elusimicrobiales bacterium]